MRRLHLATLMAMAVAPRLEQFKPTEAELTAAGVDVNKTVAVWHKQRQNKTKNERRRLKRERGHRAVRNAEKASRRGLG